jgi:16S rRNA (cytidine1402-2'-O)-methyltransferase
VARELTKVHEEVRRGTVGALAQYYREHPPRGEVTVVVGGAPHSGEPGRPPAPGPDEARALVAALRERGETPGAIAKELARRLGISRRDAYRLLAG